MMILKWSLRVLVALTLVLLVVNTVLGIGLMAIDIVAGVFYEMKRTACDRRQMKHIPVVHRM
ncbi:hypothetical protein [Lacticaseibacillus daqingensis]|uniref:hypothetical protein n=1 Tax=Lacticaseibacillus daqingensis TaxID=2486014 RepID=UPI000F775247|nr:hypothetical protein [Lacticaseibacillus daqingensis]